MKNFLAKHERLVSVAIVSFASGFALAFLVIELYANRDIVGNYCIRTAKQAQEYFKNLK